MSTTEELLNMMDERIAKAATAGILGGAGTNNTLGAGTLNPEQADRFLEKIIDQSVITKECRVVKMNARQRLIEKVGFGSRIAVNPAGNSNQSMQGTAPASNLIFVPDFQKITLTTVEVDAYVDLGFDTLEDNIEHEGFEDTLVDRVTKRLALDLEELYLLGDTSQTADQYLTLNDGWFVMATLHSFNQASATFSEDAVLGGMLDQLPVKYFNGTTRDEWRYYVSAKTERRIRRERAARATLGGDAWLQGNAPLSYLGIPIQSVPLISDSGSATGNGLLVHPMNIVVGVQREVTFDRFRNGRRRVYELTWSTRVDTVYEEGDAVVKAINVA